MKDNRNDLPQERFKTSIGGQALIEGILMRGPTKQAVVVRSKEGLVSKTEPLRLLKDRYPILGWPLVRGVVNFGSSTVNGVKALMYSAEFYPEEEEEKPSRTEAWLEKHLGAKWLEKAAIAFSVVLGLGLSVLLFIFLPTLLAGLFNGLIPSYLIRNLLEGLFRIVIFLAYLFGVSRMKDMKRVFAYHGAEHKTIRCYEAMLPLTVENVRKQTRMHPRCGTSFLFLVVIISILFFSVLRFAGLIMRFATRLLLLPVVVAVSYEITRYVGRHDNAVTHVMTAPGLWFQTFTTQEPDDDMIEVAIEAVKLVLPEHEGQDAW